MATNPNLDFPTYDEWLKGTDQKGNPLDAGDRNMPKYYLNYTNTLKELIDKGNLAHAQATVETHGHKWLTSTATTTATATDTSTDIEPDLPTKTVTPPAEDRPEYEGPAYEPWRDYDPTPVGITLAEVQDDELVENRIANMLDRGSPLFRRAAEAMARRFGNRGPRAQEAMMGAIMEVARPIAMADALMLERHRTLRNTAYYQQMNTRLSGAINEALSHIAGGYQIQATIINDITNRWKAQLAADIAQYNIDTTAATSIYNTKVNEALGYEGLQVKMAEILSNIEDNAEATAFLWDMVFGDNALNPSEWIIKWKEKYGDPDSDDDDDDDSTTTTSTRADQEASIRSRLGSNDCSGAKSLANSIGGWAIQYYNKKIPKGSPCSEIKT